MAAAVTARHEYVKLEQDISALRQLRDAPRATEMSRATLFRIGKQMRDAESSLVAKKEELNGMVYRLVDSDFWPVPPRLPIDNTNRPEEFQDVRINVLALKDRVKELSDLVQNHTLHATSVLGDSAKTNLSLPPPTLPVQQADAMEIDGPRPTKRRRLSPTETASPVQTVQTPAQLSDLAHKKEVESLSDRLAQLEYKLSDIENAMVQFDQDLSASLEEQIEEKLASMDQSSGLAVDGRIMEDVRQRLRQLDANFEQAGHEIEEVAKEVGSLITHTNELDDDIARLKAENEFMKQKITAVRAIIPRQISASY